MIGWLVFLLAAGYLLGSLPFSFLVARHLGFNLTEYGTRQVGVGNLWRMTHSIKWGIVVGIVDFGKGVLMMWLAKLYGFSPGIQIIVALAVIVGHNWSVFLRFSGGRGLATVVGIVIALPFVDQFTPWVSITFAVVGLSLLAVLRSTPAPALAALIAAPIASALVQDDPIVTLGFAGILLAMVAKRIFAPLPPYCTLSGALLLNRLLLDRDIHDRKQWMYRKPAHGPAEKRRQ